MIMMIMIRMSDVMSVGRFRYECEINKRNDFENEFVMLKKVQYEAMVAVILARLGSELFVNSQSLRSNFYKTVQLTFESNSHEM